MAVSRRIANQVVRMLSGMATVHKMTDMSLAEANICMHPDGLRKEQLK